MKGTQWPLFTVSMCWPNALASVVCAGALTSCLLTTVEPPNKVWELVFCPLFRGCPYLGGSPYFDIIIISTMFKLLWMNKITFMSVSE